MTSNVYLGHGTFNDQYVMKVGKANFVLQRELELPIKIYSSISCPEECDAFALEDNLRSLARRMGAIGIAGHIDYFVYDADIYAELEAVLACNLFVAPSHLYRKHVNLDDLEIEAIRERYAQIKKQEREAQVDFRSHQRHEQAIILKIEALESEIMEGVGGMDELQHELDFQNKMLVRIRARVARVRDLLATQAESGVAG